MILSIIPDCISKYPAPLRPSWKAFDRARRIEAKCVRFEQMSGKNGTNVRILLRAQKGQIPRLIGKHYDKRPPKARRSALERRLAKSTLSWRPSRVDGGS